jgi:hypothetical protein
MHLRPQCVETFQNIAGFLCVSDVLLVVLFVCESRSVTFDLRK